MSDLHQESWPIWYTLPFLKILSNMYTNYGTRLLFIYRSFKRPTRFSAFNVVVEQLCLVFDGSGVEILARRPAILADIC